MLRLNTYNDIMREQRFKDTSLNLAGVYCPKCFEKHEMVYTHPGMVNFSYPGSKTVQCPNCGHTGYKIVL